MVGLTWALDSSQAASIAACSGPQFQTFTTAGSHGDKFVLLGHRSRKPETNQRDRAAEMKKPVWGWSMVRGEIGRVAVRMGFKAYAGQWGMLIRVAFRGMWRPR